ncbi:MAG TPA: hypothetical protein VI685_20615 [Candidatus Angelobacter sp.]
MKEQSEDNMTQAQVAENLLDSKRKVPKQHILKTPKKSGIKEKNKAQKQRQAILLDLTK